MRSSRRSSLPPCPCNNVCRCHNKSGNAVAAWLVLLGTFVFLFFFLLWAYPTLHPKTKRYIEVDGKMCMVNFKEDGHTSTGAVWGHDVADCKNGKESKTTN